MNRSSSKRKVWLAAIALCSGALAAVNCSKNSSSDKAGKFDDVGAIGMAITLHNGADVQTVAYRVTGPNNFLRQGNIPVTDPSGRVSVFISGIPAGMGYTAELTAVSTDGRTTCAGRQTFNVLAGTTVTVNVVLLCRTAGDTGNAIINGSFNQCPVITGATATPQAVAVGNSLDLAATASDADMGDTVTFAWTAPAGTFSAPAAAATSYTCTQGGTQNIVLTISDGQCGDTMTIPVECVTLSCGNGMVEPNLGEQCDPPSAANHCDMNCRIIPVCGNGTVEAGEQCDPPNMSATGPNTCDQNCQNVAIACGNSLIQPGEQCDPPNGTTCSTTCQTLTPPVCGNGVVEMGEQCDPPNGTTCSSTCQTIVQDLCTPCYEENVANGNCPNAVDLNGGTVGCDDIPATGVGPGATTNDRALCEALDTCMRMTRCWIDPTGVRKCLCGTAVGTACAGPAADGACKQQIMAATRATNETAAGNAILSKNVPAGWTTQKYACYGAFCMDMQQCAGF